jgi:site-specific DNA recombinase
MVIPGGRKAKSERLLARLGVLRCGSCGARMVVGTARQGGKRYPYYRCPPVGDCPQRVTISAPLVEGVVVAAVRRRLADVEGRASAERNVHDAQVTLDRAQSDLDAAIRAFAGLEDEDAARTRLAELRDARDEAREHVEHLGSPRLVMTVNLSRDWDLLTLEERRAAIRLTVAAVRVAPGVVLAASRSRCSATKRRATESARRWRASTTAPRWRCARSAPAPRRIPTRSCRPG